MSTYREDRLVLVDQIVSDLVSRGADPERLMVVGAEARDWLHHVGFGRSDEVRSTSDVDIAIATDHWDTYEGVVRGYPRTGANGVRFIVAGLEVDVMPFGAVEDPDGVVEPARRREQMSVFGMADVFAGATVVSLPCGERVRFPTAPGYVLLKLRAWVDRGAVNDRDARDLALAVDWYCQDEAVRDASWDEDRIDLMDLYDSNTDYVAARVLGRQAAAVVTVERAVELEALLRQNPIDPRVFEVSARRRTDIAERTARVRALTDGVSDTVRSMAAG